MRLAMWATLALGLAAGCGGPDPDASRLPAGSTVYLKSISKISTVNVRGQSKWSAVEPGAKATIVQDDKGGDDDKRRDVLVHVDDGPHEGTSGLVKRQECQPAR